MNLQLYVLPLEVTLDYLKLECPFVYSTEYYTMTYKKHLRIFATICQARMRHWCSVITEFYHFCSITRLDASCCTQILDNQIKNEREIYIQVI